MASKAMNMQEIAFRPIGEVRHGFSDDQVRGSRNGVDGQVVVYDEYLEGLAGIEGFSHIIIISYINRLRPFEVGVLRVKPRRFTRFGVKPEELPEVGVFALDSPNRPNPIGLTVVRLKEVRGGTLEVSGLDLFNGTPVLDIKPYTPERALVDIKIPEWLSRLLAAAGER